MGVIDDQTQSLPAYGEIALPNGETITWGTPGITPVGTYGNVAQYGDTRFQWDPTAQVMQGQVPETSPGYVTELLGLRERVRQGQAQPYEAEQYRQWEAQARAIPTRDLATLTAAWQGEREGRWGDAGWQAGAQDWWQRLDPGSPDVGPIMLGLRDKIDAGTATPQERALFDQVYGMAADWTWRASVPQASDANPFGMGDQFMMALAALTAATGGAGAFGAFGAGAAGAGAASASAAPSLLGVPLSTLSTIGQIGTYGGLGANVLGAALDQPWLRTIGLGLGVTGGLAGGLAGLGNVLNTGVNSLTDAARLAQSAGRLTGAVGTASGQQALGQASRYLGMAGRLGSLGGQVLPTDVTDWSGTNAPLAANVNPAITTAADWSTQRGGPMDTMDYGWESWDDGGMYAGGSPTFDESAYVAPIGPGMGWDASSNPAYQQFLSWNAPTGVGSSGDPAFAGEGSLLSTLGGLGSSALGFLRNNGSWLGPAASGLGSVGAGALGANASSEAARLQAAALNRGLDLQTAQWLQQQANQAPWLQAGQQALPQLQQLAGQGSPTLQQAAPVRGADYGLPGATPGWTPQTYAGYTPTATPSAAGYRYTPGQAPRAADYRYTPGALPTLSGQELLANDPGVQFRLDEGRRALEASAAARGGLLSGSTLAALQRQGQDLSSQEYANAWNRAAQQAQMREQWGQTASQMGWSQAEAETRLREMLAQTAGAQNWQQALQEAQARAQQQQFGWNAGMQAQQQGQRERQAYDTDLYTRQWQQAQTIYGRDQAQREAENQRLLDAYNAQRQGQNTAWNQYAALAGLGQTAVGQLGTQGQANATQQASLLGQLGSAQGIGALGAASNWNRAIGGVTNNVSDLLAGLNR